MRGRFDPALLRLLARAQNRPLAELAEKLTPDDAAALEAAAELIGVSAGRWTLTPQGKAALRRFAGVNPNTAYRLLRSISGISHEDVAAALAADGSPTPINTVRAWSRHPSDRRNKRLSWEELIEIMFALADHLPPLED